MLNTLNDKEYECISRKLEMPEFAWIKNSLISQSEEVFNNIDDLDNENIKNIPIYPLKFNNIQDFQNIIKTMAFSLSASGARGGKIQHPYSYEFWDIFIKNLDIIENYINHEKKYVQIISYLKEFLNDSINKAAQKGEINLLRILYNSPDFGKGKKYFWNEWACADAAKNGHLDCLIFLRENNCPWDEETCSCAAKNGHIEILIWCRSQDPPCPWSEWTCAFAAANGHIEILKWCRSQNPPCPWDEYTCSYAALKGHLEILKWCRSIDRSQNPPCPWDAYTCTCAAENGHLEILIWCRSQNPPCPWTESTCATAAENGQLETLKWLRSQKPPCPSLSASGASGGDEETEKYGYEHEIY